MGKLSATDFAFAESTVQTLLDMRAKCLSDLQKSGTHGPADAYQQASATFDHEVTLQMLHMLRNGEYVTLPPEQQVPSFPGIESMSFGMVKDGTAINLWILLDGKRHPEIADLARYRDSVHDVWLDEVVQSFNNLPLGERRRLIDAHAERSRRSQNTWNAQEMAEERSWFPPPVVVDSAASLLHRQG